MAKGKKSGLLDSCLNKCCDPISKKRCKKRTSWIRVFAMRWGIKLNSLYCRIFGPSIEAKLLTLLFLILMYSLSGIIHIVLRDIFTLNLSFSKQWELYSLNKKTLKPSINYNTINQLNNLQNDVDLILTGMVHNAETTLPDLLEQVEIFACSVHYSHIVIFESNSDDSTASIVTNWVMNENTYNHEIKDDFIRTSYKSCLNVNGNSDSVIRITALQPLEELEIVLKIYKLYEKSNRDPEQKGFYFGTVLSEEDIRIAKYIEWRNWLLDYINHWIYYDIDNEYELYNTDIDINYLMWIDFDLIGFNVENYLKEFSNMLQYKDRDRDQYYHVFCGMSIKYNGWYYDSYSSILNDRNGKNESDWVYFDWSRDEIANVLNSRRYFPMKSCFGGVAIYDFKFLIDSECRYMHILDAYDTVKTFRHWLTDYELKRHEKCEHIAMNMCLLEHGANIAVSSKSHVYYGTSEEHGMRGHSVVY